MHRILARLPNFRRSRRGDSEVPRCDPRLHGRTAIALLLWGAHGSERYRRWMQTFVRIPGDRPFALRRAGHPDEPQRDDADEHGGHARDAGVSRCRRSRGTSIANTRGEPCRRPLILTCSISLNADVVIAATVRVAAAEAAAAAGPARSRIAEETTGGRS